MLVQDGPLSVDPELGKLQDDARHIPPIPHTEVRYGRDALTSSDDILLPFNTRLGDVTPAGAVDGQVTIVCFPPGFARLDMTGTLTYEGFSGTWVVTFFGGGQTL